MHELVALTETIEQVERVAKEKEIKKIKAIVLEIGEASGYLPSFVTACYPRVIRGKPLFRGCELRIVRTKGEALCGKCRSHYNVVLNRGICPKCCANEPQMISGDEFLIKEILY